LRLQPKIARIGGHEKHENAQKEESKSGRQDQLALIFS
jgi:hypothetical protein